MSQQKSYEKISIENSEQQDINKYKILKKLKGNSQFIRQKFDVQYKPKIRKINSDIGGFNVKKMQKKYQQRIKMEEFTSELTAKSIKNGKKIIIDWTKRDKFRITKFPALKQGYFEQIKLLKPERKVQSKNQDMQTRKGSQNLSRILQKSINKQITSKSQHLQDLLYRNAIEKKMRYRQIYSLQGLKLNNKSTSWYKSIKKKQLDPHFNYSIIQDIEQKSKQFFFNNVQQIQAAINYQMQMSKLIQHQSFQENNKYNIQDIHERIVCKSKLALLKSELVKKFREIKEGILDNCEVIYSQKNAKS